jgi:hypothetical protein
LIHDEQQRQQQSTNENEVSDDGHGPPAIRAPGARSGHQREKSGNRSLFGSAPNVHSLTRPAEAVAWRIRVETTMSSDIANAAATRALETYRLINPAVGL